MPTHIRAHCQWQVGSPFPRDVVQITPCFRHQGILPGDDPNWQTLADDLSAGLNTFNSTIGNSMASTVKVYEIKDPVPGVPNRPKATKAINPTNMAEAGLPREVALCLSFYGGPNGPRNRGRLYIPAFMLVPSVMPVRPAQATRDKVGTLVALFAGLGGIDVDWIVWSQTNKAATKIDHWYVDDEWDAQRRRGLQPSTRSSGTTGG
jgi:hypothetical protein